MKVGRHSLDFEIQSLLARGKIIRRLPSAVRMRTLARATFALGAADAIAAVERRNHRLLTVVAILVCLAGVASGALLTLRIPWFRQHLVSHADPSQGRTFCSHH